MSDKLLVIDDDYRTHILVSAHLGNGRTEICSALDGESGIEIAAKEQPDLILLDVDMPQVSGHEVLHRLKADPATRSIPILFLSSDTSTDSKVRGIDMGAIDYIAKPFDPFELRARAKSALRTKRRLDRSVVKTMIDEETGLFNRAYMERHLTSMLAAARRSNCPMACIIIEVNGIDAAYSEYGSDAVEEVMRSVAAAVVETSREEDTICRYATQQFAVLAARVDTATVSQFAERIRFAILSSVASGKPKTPILSATCGVGIVRFSFDRSVVKDAEDALAHAKQTGLHYSAICHDAPDLHLQY